MTTSNGGWTVIQRRVVGSVNFYRKWVDYKKGFGNKLGEYWLGLDNIHALTSKGQFELLINMADFKGNNRFAKYNSFMVMNEANNYRLQVSGYSGKN